MMIIKTKLRDFMQSCYTRPAIRVLSNASSTSDYAKAKEVLRPCDITHEYIDVLIDKCFSYWKNRYAHLPVPLNDIVSSIVHHNEIGKNGINDAGFDQNSYKKLFYQAFLDKLDISIETIHYEALIHIETAIKHCKLPESIYQVACDDFAGFVQGGSITSMIWTYIQRHKCNEALLIASMAWDGDDWFKPRFYNILCDIDISQVTFTHGIMKKVSTIGVPNRIYWNILYNQDCLYGKDTCVEYWEFMDHVRASLISEDDSNGQVMPAFMLSMSLFSHLAQNLDTSPSKCHRLIAKAIVEITKVDIPTHALFSLPSKHQMMFQNLDDIDKQSIKDFNMRIKWF